MVLNLKKLSEALDQVAQRNCGCPVPVSVQGQPGFGQPGLVTL